MNKFIDTLRKQHPLLSRLSTVYGGLNANFCVDDTGISLNRQENDFMREHETRIFKENKQVAAQSHVICSIIEDNSTEYVRLSDNVTSYITQLNGFESVLEDVIPLGRMLIKIRLNSNNVCLFLAHEHDTVFVFSISGDNDQYSTHHIYTSKSVFKTTDGDIYTINGNDKFNGLSFVIKLFKLMKDKIPVSETVEKIPRFKTGKHKLTRDVRYISLSETGIARAKKVEEAIKIIRADPKYGVAVWWRRPHYRGETYIDGVWCHRKAGEVTDKRETVYTM